MKPLKQLLFIAGFCSVILPLYGQTNDWRSVEALAPGTSISVVKHHGRQDCELMTVTDHELDCDRHIGRVVKRLVFARDEVREVRLENPDDNRMLAGAIIGGAVGGLVGFLAGGRSSDPETRVAAPLCGALSGGSFAAGIGHGIHRHGRIVYRP